MPHRSLSRMFFIALAALITGAATDAQAQRVSLSGMDAKLDQLVGGVFDPSRHVTLSATYDTESPCSWDRAFHRLNLDGTLDSQEFVVPADHTLILTDISWTASASPTAFGVGRTTRLYLTAMDPSGPNARSVYQSPGLEITADNQYSRIGENETLAAGVAIGEGRIVCPSVSSQTSSGSATNTISSGFLRGVLVPNP